MVVASGSGASTQWLAINATLARNSGLLISMNGNRRSKELYAHRVAMDKPQHRKGKRSITSRARSSAMDTWIEIFNTRFVTRVYSSTISAR